MASSRMNAKAHKVMRLVIPSLIVCLFGIQTSLLSEIFRERRIIHVSPSQLSNNDNTRRVLPMTESYLTADWIYNTTSGSFWLPQPPDEPVSSFTARFEGNTFETDYYKGRSGFMHNDKIDIMMARGTGFNAGDFYAAWIAPMIAGRPPNLPNKDSFDRCSLAVVGSILQWGIRYVWSAGFIDSKQGLDKHTEHVFAVRGPSSHKRITEEKTVPVAPIFGDAGLLMSWYYQPHNQTKSYNLCLIPHFGDKRAPILESIKNEWKGKTHQIDIEGPIFSIMDNITKCQFVLSSSLHGMIFADSYGIPNAHMNVSRQVSGGSYKFDDYFQSVNRTRLTLELVNRTDVKMEEIRDIIDQSDQATNINLLPLWSAAPMHAQAYNRTREEHLEFAKHYAQKFAETLDRKPANLTVFLDQMEIPY